MGLDALVADTASVLHLRAERTFFSHSTRKCSTVSQKCCNWAHLSIEPSTHITRGLFLSGLLFLLLPVLLSLLGMLGRPCVVLCSCLSLAASVIAPFQLLCPIH